MAQTFLDSETLSPSQYPAFNDLPEEELNVSPMGEFNCNVKSNFERGILSPFVYLKNTMNW